MGNVFPDLCSIQHNWCSATCVHFLVFFRHVLLTCIENQYFPFGIFCKVFGVFCKEFTVRETFYACQCHIFAWFFLKISCTYSDIFLGWFCVLVPMSWVWGFVLVPLGTSFSFDPFLMVVDSVAVSAQDYAFFNLFVGFGKLSVRYELVDTAFFCTRVFVMKV